MNAHAPLLKWPVLFAAVAGCLAGCAGNGDRGAVNGRPVTMDEFVRVDAGVINHIAREPGTAAAPGTNTTRPTSANANGTSRPSGAAPTVAPLARRDPAAGEPVVIDSLVGEVNGRPVFAEQFFAPLDAYLRREAERQNPSEFDRTLMSIIEAQLRSVAQNELFIQEARGTLSVEQQTGVFQWMRQMQENIISESGGTRAGATQRLAEESGISIEDRIDEITRMALARKLYEEKIAPLVIVSWRDIEREYDRNFAYFNPPASAVVQRITLNSTSQQTEIDDVTRRLAAGESFESIARAMGSWSDRGWQTFELGPEGLAGAPLVRNLTEALATLEPGGVTPSIEITAAQSGMRTTWWLHLAEIRQPPIRSLYDHDVQRELRQALSEQRRGEVERRYFDSLLDEKIVMDLSQMRDRLVIIGRRRYKP